MDTKIPDEPGVDLHPTSKCPHVVLGASSAATAQAHPDDGGVHYLQRVLLVSITRAITMCASTALRFLLRLSPRRVRGVSRCLTIWTGRASRPCLAVQVARARLLTPSELRRHPQI